MNFFCVTFELSRIPQRILRILAKEFERREDKGDGPRNAAWETEGLGTGVLGERAILPSHRKGNIWPRESGS